MNVVGVIPARYGAQRFPGKPLALIAGKPMLQRVVEGARKAKKINRLIVATDDQRIVDFCKVVNVECKMTSPEIPTGSDRVWAVASEIDCTHILNIQGDEPLIDGSALDTLVTSMETDSSVQMSTLATDLKAEDIDSLNSVKVILDKSGDAIYFSRYPIPFSRLKFDAKRRTSLKHMGMYGFKKEFMKIYCSQKPTELELCESLEQLRALYLGVKIRVSYVDLQCWGVDAPEDVLEVEKLLRGNK
jgi:3-deoxy-manno-octulosonate cytidylyltransferase (CMP-KDO synthetase)